MLPYDCGPRICGYQPPVTTLSVTARRPIGNPPIFQPDVCGRLIRGTGHGRSIAAIGNISRSQLCRGHLAAALPRSSGRCSAEVVWPQLCRGRLSALTGRRTRGADSAAELGRLTREGFPSSNELRYILSEDVPMDCQWLQAN